jgi:hypothetical protein
MQKKALLLATALLTIATQAFGADITGATSNRVAMHRIVQDRAVAPQADYAWDRTYCLRYRSQHPDRNSIPTCAWNTGTG